MQETDTHIQSPSVKSFFSEGYLLKEQLIDPQVCDDLSCAFKAEVKPYTGAILRSTTAKNEVHHFSEAGLMTNPLLNIHEFDKTLFPEFYNLCLDILADENLQELIGGIFKESGVLVQSVFYESSMGTSPHEDSHYFDSEKSRMFGCWIALEDIPQEAGRFCVYPKTHLLGDATVFPKDVNMAYRDYEKLSLSVIRDYKESDQNPSLADFKDRLKAIKQILKEQEIEPISPAVNKGDVLLFSSRTLHSGDFPEMGTRKSRASLIGHFVPASEKLIRYGQDLEVLTPVKMNNLAVNSSNPSSNAR